MRLDARRSYVVAMPPPALWRRLTAVADYPAWWPWLRSFDAAELATGEVWTCAIHPPVPYTVRCTVRLERVEAPRLVQATVGGDLRGPARLDLVGTGDTGRAEGTRATFTSSLAARGRAVAVVARVVPPLARWGHAWVLDTAARQFGAVVGGSMGRHR
ncbi:MAG TPA: hypothetical protein VFW63_03945 [Acidimicrobiales bacterium]|nr:hypothetical protein [Acidimicrobiales bacterium]